MRFIKLPQTAIGPAIAVVTVLALWSMSSSEPGVARVPELVGLHSSAARALASEGGFETTTQTRALGGKSGTVVDQDPSAGTLVERGTVVTLGVTRGVKQVAVPNVAGMPVTEARKVLVRAGLEVDEVIYREYPDREPGRVVSTNPRARKVVDEGTNVDIIAVIP